MNENKITLPEIKDALKRSGYLIESRLANILADLDYFVHPNTSYPDSQTGKSREIDINAYCRAHVKTIKLNESLRIVTIPDLIIECVNNSQPAVFFRRTDKSRRTVFEKFRYTRHDRLIKDDADAIDWDFNDHITGSEDFHYNSINHCSQYCSFSLKKPDGTKKREWFASHPDGFHDTFNKLYDFVEHQKQVSYQNNPIDSTELVVFYPILVLQGDLYEAYETPGVLKLKKIDHTIYEFNRFREKYSESLLIDVVTEKYFPKYLNLIKKDMDAFFELFMSFYKDQELEPIPKPVVKSVEV